MATTRITVLAALLAATASACGEPTAASAPAVTAQKVPKLRTIPVTAASPAAVDAFETGRDFADNMRIPEALEQFRKAVAADPDFAQAHAYLGGWQEGAEGLAELDRAVALSSKLPAAERDLIASMAAMRRGDEARSLALLRQVAESAPDSWRAHYELGNRLFGWYHLDEAVAEFQAASDMNPKVGSIFNMLGYVHLTRGDAEDAITAFTKYTALDPNEPNPYDSLAEALMAAGRFDEAEETYQKALSVAPNFHWSWVGIAQSEAFRGDWEACRAALAEAKKAATRPFDQAETDFPVAWSYAAEGRLPEALATLDALEKSAADQGFMDLYAWVPLDRARILIAAGRSEEALPLLDEALKRAAEGNLPGGPMNSIRRGTLVARVDAQAKLRQPQAAQATLALAEAEATRAPNNRSVVSMADFARGATAMASQDFAAATRHFRRCLRVDYNCHLAAAEAQIAAGDPAGARATLEGVLSVKWRDHVYLWTFSEARRLIGEVQVASAR